MMTGASGAISRKDIKRQEAHANLYYEEIRKRSSDIVTIAGNSGFSVDDIKNIKGHLFFNRYDLGELELSRFDPSYDIAISWQRLIDGDSIREMDIVLLRHELMECNLMHERGLDYRTAHDMAELKYNYKKYVDELDRKDGLHE